MSNISVDAAVLASEEATTMSNEINGIVQLIQNIVDTFAGPGGDDETATNAAIAAETAQKEAKEALVTLSNGFQTLQDVKEVVDGHATAAELHHLTAQDEHDFAEEEYEDALLVTDDLTALEEHLSTSRQHATDANDAYLAAQIV